MIDTPVHLSVKDRFRGLSPYLILCLAVWGYYFFFCENLPWFWYDDISVLERAEATSVLDNLTGILNFAPTHYYIDNRPVLILFSKVCRALFGDDPGYHRLLKMVAYSSLLVLMLRLLSRHAVERKYSVILLLFFSSLPPAFIVNSWIYEAETLELLFKVMSFSVFWSCFTGDRTKWREHLLKCVFLVLLVVVADKTKAPAKIIPVIFLSFLAIVRSRDKMLYAASLTSLAVVFPYGMLSGGTGVLASGAAPELFKTFFTQMVVVLAAASISIVVARKSIFRNRLFLFGIIWLACELVFYKAFPSGEMRYLYSSMAAACFLTAICLSHGVAAIQVRTGRKFFSAVVLVLLFAVIGLNSYWIYCFRASFCSTFILADKTMDFTNKNFSKSLYLHNYNTQFYYQRKTSNRYVSVPLYEKEMRMSVAAEVYKPYEHVLADLESASLLMTDNRLPFNVVYELSSDTNAYFDRFQSVVKVRTKVTNLYDNSLRMLTTYPAVKPLYLMEFSLSAADPTTAGRQ